MHSIRVRAFRQCGRCKCGTIRLDLCNTNETKGWSFYCAEPEPQEEPEEEEPENVDLVVPQPVPTEPQKGPATLAIEAYRAHVDEVKYRAVLDPTPENVLAYMDLQKELGDKAGAFTEQWQRNLYSAPHLDANVEYPLTAAGVGVYQDQLKAVRDNTLTKVASTSGIMFLFEDSAKCGVCRVQGEILAALQKRLGITILGVSKDGAANPDFSNAVHDNERLAQMGLAEFPAPTLALVNPHTNEIAVIGSGLLAEEQILERVYVITEVPVGERY